MSGCRLSGFSDAVSSMALLEAVLDHLPDGVLVVDQDWRMIYFNRRFVEMWEIPDDIQRIRDDRQSIQTVLNKLEDPQSFLERVEYLQANPDLCSRDELRLKNGRIFDRFTSPLRDHRGLYLGRIWFFRDLTDKARMHQRRMELEGQLKRLEKLESLRTFAASLSHHLNNLLFGILGNLELAENSVKSSNNGSTEQHLKLAKEITEKAAMFSQRMLCYLGHNTINCSRLHIQALIHEVLDSMKEYIPERIEIEISPEEEGLWMEGDRRLLKECLKSILFNSLEAIDGEGKVTISWSRVERPEIKRRAFPLYEEVIDAPPRHYFCL